jgi:hypothetical protein
MSRFQTLVIFILSLCIDPLVQAETCSKYIIHGIVREVNNQVIVLVHESSRSETEIQLPSVMQSILKKQIGHRIELHCLAAKKDDYFYQAYYRDDLVKFYPFTSQRTDSIEVALDEPVYNCEK